MNTQKDDVKGGESETFEEESDVRYDTIVTFSCNNNVHLYDSNSPVRPRSPYKTHDSVDQAIAHVMKREGAKEVQIIKHSGKVEIIKH